MKCRLFVIFWLLPTLLLAQRDPSLISNRKKEIKNDFLLVKINPLNKNINTEFSEYNAILFEDSIFYFTVLQNVGDDDFDKIFASYWTMQIYHSRLSTRSYSKPKSLPKELNDSKYFNVNFTFNQDRDEIYIGRSQAVIDQELKCELWHAKYQRGKWGSFQKLPETINLPDYNTTQPFLVEYEDYKVLYFASNRPNGFGGMDIWFTIIKDGKYGTPINLGSFINTKGDEVTPFYDKENHTLYFSSNAHVGLGGFDVFSSNGALSNWSTPDNLGSPINTSANELYFTYNTFNDGGYFSSNRPHERTKPKDSCCYDIFSYQRLLYRSDTLQMQDTMPEDTVPVTQKIEKRLPLVLYFHNDMPDPRSKNESTDAGYIETLEDYMELRPLYILEYTKGLKGKEKELAEKRIEDFFTEHVEKSYHNLEYIMELLTKELSEGRSITIYLSGYASALHAKDYNRKLAARRIMSFENYIRRYEDGLLIPYWEGKKKNTLRIIPNVVGSEEAILKKVSANAKDQRNSIYSVEASSERRVEITRILITD